MDNLFMTREERDYRMVVDESTCAFCEYFKSCWLCPIGKDVFHCSYTPYTAARKGSLEAAVSMLAYVHYIKDEYWGRYKRLGHY